MLPAQYQLCFFISCNQSTRCLQHEIYLQDLVNNQEQWYHLYYFGSIWAPTNQQLDKGYVRNLMKNVLQRLTYFNSWFLVGSAVLGVYGTHGK